MTKNRVGGAILFLVGLGYFVAACNLPVSLMSEGLGSSFWPQAASIGLMVCSIGVIFSKPKGDEPKMTKQELMRCIVYFGLLLAYVACIKVFGFVLSTLVFSYISVSVMAVDGVKPAVWKRVCFSVSMTVVTYLVFVKVFLVLLPTGMLF